MTTAGKCTCGAPVLFVVMAGTRKQMPIDPQPDDENGTVVFVWGLDGKTELARVERKDELEAFRGKRLLYRAHWDRCPHAERHRKTKKTKAA